MSNVYLDTRKALGLSRADVSAYAMRAGHKLSTSSIDKLEKAEADSTGTLMSTIEAKDGSVKTVATIGSRGLPISAVDYLNYLLGIGEYSEIDWSEIERGAPVLVHGETGSWSFSSMNEDGSIQVFGGKGAVASFRSFNEDRIRLVAPTALPSEDSAALFESAKRGPRGSNNMYATEILGYFDRNPGMAHSVGALSYALSRDNGLVSRTVAALVTKGELVKVARGTFVRGDGKPASDEAVVKADADADADADDSAPTPEF